MVETGIVEPVKHSEWAAPIVPILKPNGKMRICVDFKYLNSQLNVEKYPVPRLDEMLSVISSNKYFSKIDLTNAYLQMSVDEECQNYLVMSTQKGLFKFKRLCYGLASAPGIFQRFMSELLSDFEGAVCYLDDILICSESKAEQHDKIKAVLARLQGSNVNLNWKKCQFDLPEIDFLGYVVSEKGISPSPSKVSAILEAPVPNNLTELQSFIGMVTYYSRFIRNFSEILSPLYELTKKQTKFVWGKRQQVAYNVIKRSICNSEILTCFTGKSKLIVEVDASPIGVGAVLIQSEKGVEKPIMFASKKLSPAENNYSQADRE